MVKHRDLGLNRAGTVLRVTLKPKNAIVRFMDDHDYRRYLQTRCYTSRGQHVSCGKVRFMVPYSARWHVTADWKEPQDAKVECAVVCGAALPERKRRISSDQLYYTLTSLVIHSEQIRWARLNTYLVLASASLAAWALLYAGTDEFDTKRYYLVLLTLPHGLLGILWGQLGKRSSEYLEDSFEDARFMEGYISSILPTPFLHTKARRDKVKQGLRKWTSSERLVTCVPYILGFFFCVLALLSWMYRPPTFQGQEPAPQETPTVTIDREGRGEAIGNEGSGIEAGLVGLTWSTEEKG